MGLFGGDKPKKPTLIWQGINSTSDALLVIPNVHIWRAKVPGGWLVTSCNSKASASPGSGLTFVPDPNHEWDGGSL